MHNEDARTTEELAEGIRSFCTDARKLEQYARTRVAQKMAGRSAVALCVRATQSD